MVRIGVGAHPSGVGTDVPLVRPLVVLDQGQRDYVLPVDEDHLGELFSDGPLLEDDSGAADVVVEDLVDVLHGLREAMEVLALHLDALSAGEPHRLHDDLVVYTLEVLLGVFGVVEVGEPQVPCYAMLLDELPHEGLGGLDPGRSLGRGGAFDALLL